MNTPPPFGFTRARGMRQLLVPLLLLPFVLVALAFGAMTFTFLRSARAVDGYETALITPARGRVRVVGAVSRDAMVTSPLGASAVGWVGAVGHLTKDSDGDVTFNTVCVRSDLSALHIKTDLQDWSVSFVDPSDPVVLGNHTKLDDTLPIVDIGAPVAPTGAGTIPDAMQRACSSAIAANATRPLVYREAVLAPGTRVEMLGCADGARVVRCAEGGPYLFTTSTVSAIEDASRTTRNFFMLFGGGWNLVIMTLVGVMLADRLLRSKPTFPERLRAR